MVSKKCLCENKFINAKKVENGYDNSGEGCGNEA